MENKNRYLGIVILIIVLLVVVFIFGWLLGGYMENNKENSRNIIVEDSEDNNSNRDNYINENKNNNNVVDNELDDVNIEILSIDEVKVGSEYVNHTMFGEGKMKLSFDNDKYYPLSLNGYCEDTNNIRYNFVGPNPSTSTGFYSETTDKVSNFNFVNTINSEKGDIVLADGTIKNIGEIKVDWDNINIKTCVVEYASLYTKESKGKELKKIELNYKKDFN